MCLCVRVGDHQPDVVAHDDHGIVDAQVRGQQLADVFGHGLLVIPGGRAPRLPGTPVVGRDDPEAALSERGDDQAPFTPGLREAVQETMVRDPFPAVTKCSPGTPRWTGSSAQSSTHTRAAARAQVSAWIQDYNRTGGIRAGHDVPGPL